MAILKIRDENGNVVEIAALKGEKGDLGGSIDEDALDEIIAIQKKLIENGATFAADYVVEDGVCDCYANNPNDGSREKLTATMKYRKWHRGGIEIFGEFLSNGISFSVDIEEGMVTCMGTTQNSVLTFVSPTDGVNLLVAYPDVSVGNSGDAGLCLSLCGHEMDGLFGVSQTYWSFFPRTDEHQIWCNNIYVRGRWK